jgi:hypothetical protein
LPINIQCTSNFSWGLGMRTIDHSEAKLHHFDIVRKDNDKYAIWLESATNLGAAESRIEELTEVWPGEFQVVDRQSHQVVARLRKSPSVGRDRFHEQ